MLGAFAFWIIALTMKSVASVPLSLGQHEEQYQYQNQLQTNQNHFSQNNFQQHQQQGAVQYNDVQNTELHQQLNPKNKATRGHFQSFDDFISSLRLQNNKQYQLQNNANLLHNNKPALNAQPIVNNEEQQERHHKAEQIGGVRAERPLAPAVINDKPSAHQQVSSQQEFVERENIQRQVVENFQKPVLDNVPGSVIENFARPVLENIPKPLEHFGRPVLEKLRKSVVENKAPEVEYLQRPVENYPVESFEKSTVENVNRPVVENFVAPAPVEEHIDEECENLVQVQVNPVKPPPQAASCSNVVASATATAVAEIDAVIKKAISKAIAAVLACSASNTASTTAKTIPTVKSSESSPTGISTGNSITSTGPVLFPRNSFDAADDDATDTTNVDSATKTSDAACVSTISSGTSSKDLSNSIISAEDLDKAYVTDVAIAVTKIWESQSSLNGNDASRSSASSEFASSQHFSENESFSKASTTDESSSSSSSGDAGLPAISSSSGQKRVASFIADVMLSDNGEVEIVVHDAKI